MTFETFSRDLFAQGDVDLLEYLRESSAALRLLFLNAQIDADSQRLAEQTYHLFSQKQVTLELRGDDHYQATVNHFASYFKRSKRIDLVAACRQLSVRRDFNKRIDAYISVNRYSDAIHHITRFEKYLSVITGGVENEDTDYTSAIVEDIKDYHDFGRQQLEHFGYPHKVAEFIALFSKDEIVKAFPILRLVYDVLYNRYYDLPVNDISDKVYEPSDFSHRLFNDRITDYIKNHSKTGSPWYESPLGFDVDTVRYEILSTGLADFDQPYMGLSPAERVKLYCYMNMRKHFFTSRSIFERCPQLLTYYSSEKRIKFIDIGCGPATSGLAFVDFIHSETASPVFFDYYGVDISNAMLDEARAMMDNIAITNDSSKIFTSELNSIDLSTLSNSSCILINTCYLFASTRLDIEQLSTFINEIRSQFSGTPMFLIFQNPSNRDKNSNYFRFKQLIDPVNVTYSAVDIVYYSTRRHNPFSPSCESVYYELLKL